MHSWHRIRKFGSLCQVWSISYRQLSVYAVQMPILFALYRVIYAIPAYVGRVKEAFFPLVDNIIDTAGATELVQNLSNSAMYSKQFTNSGFVAGTHSEYVQNTIIDCLNKASTADFASISEKFPSLAADVTNTVSKLEEYNNFLGLNIGNSPSYVLKEAWANGAWLLVIGAIAIPVLSALTQWINVKLMPQQDTSSNNGNDQAAAMASSMKTMNMIMPLMSAWFCFTLPSGLSFFYFGIAVSRYFTVIDPGRNICFLLNVLGIHGSVSIQLILLFFHLLQLFCTLC